MDNETLLNDFAAQHFERHSISAYRRVETMRVLRVLIARLDGRLLAELTPADLMEWQAAELKRGNAPTTVLKKENQIRAFVSWAQQSGAMSWELAARLKSLDKPRGASAKKTPRPYTRGEIENLRIILQRRYPLIPRSGKGSRMLKYHLRGKSEFKGPLRRHAIRLQYEAQIALALEEGLRATEIFNLTLAQMHPDNVGVLVETAKGKPGERRERVVPYTAHARTVVGEWMEFRMLAAPRHARPWLSLFFGDGLAPQKWRSFQFALQGLAPEYKWHRLRHTFATERLRAGVPLEKLQVMLGHANVTQTLGYAEIVSADVQVVAERTEAAFARSLGLPSAA